MSEGHVCSVCGCAIAKHRRFCSLECHGISMRDKPAWNKGRKTGPTAPRMPCRICGEPTRYYACDHRLEGLVTCGRPECVAASRALKNERIGEAHRERVTDGRHQTRKDGWAKVALISREETVLSDWFVSVGWVPQHRVLTGVHTNKLPRQFRLDFALPDRRLYVEIDGSVHRSKDRRARDVRRDTMLSDLGWVGLRIPAKRVRDDPEAVKRAVLGWLSSR